MDLEIFQTRGVGDASYLIASHGEAALVDPQRDAWRFLAVAEARGWRVSHVLETHVHNDYLSGALETRALTGARIVAPARGGFGFEHRGVDDGDQVEVGSLRLTALATPGHTPEHLAWTVGDHEGQPEAVFSGGSLLVGTAGRTDLLGPELEPGLTAGQQQTLRRLAALPSGVQILPTHGAGSFCSVGPTPARRITTLGEELAGNELLQLAPGDPVTFRARLLEALGRYPAYYRHMAAINRAGPRRLGGPLRPPGLQPPAFESAAATGVTVVDARDRKAFAGAHQPGALNIELDDTFAAYVGWLVPFGTPLALVVPEPVDESLAEATTQLLRIGYDDIRGWLAGGIDAWAASGRTVSSYPTITIRDVRPADGETVLDVRQPIEWRDGMIPGSTGIFVADLPARLDEIPRGRPVTVLCKTGSRAAIAASILDAAGHDVRLVARGGAPSWRA